VLASGAGNSDSSQHSGQQSGTAVGFSDGGMVTSGSFMPFPLKAGEAADVKDAPHPACP